MIKYDISKAFSIFKKIKYFFIDKVYCNTFTFDEINKEILFVAIWYFSWEFNFGEMPKEVDWLPVSNFWAKIGIFLLGTEMLVSRYHISFILIKIIIIS